ncbi:6-phosphofructokinase [Deefgea rivuli]|uniref:6-phosphofructokinase n=1 Tax=Deefgea rivuli TaxID=400948 RepID=UPI00047F9901|nr:6-phosphofructokinase [Deefgea rivuli]
MPMNALYAQSGGVTPVINASAAGVISAARQHPSHIGRIFAAKNGILGVLHEELIDTACLTTADLAQLKATPGGAFGSCRHKIKTEAELARLLAVLKAWDIGYFFYNGGGDSADTCLKVAELAQAAGYPLLAIHVPKTIDNDLPHTDNSPGFGSVAKYVATSVREAGLDVASMAASSTKVFILEVMGRHTGWIAAASGLAARTEGEPPHLILLPEVAVNEERLLAAVENTVARYGYCVIVAAEGAKDTQGNFLAEAGGTDAFGHVQLGGTAPYLAALIKARCGFKCHWSVADYLQRAARHIASATDLAQAIAVGEAAVKLAVAGQGGMMTTIERLSDAPYTWDIGAVPLGVVANCEKPLPPEFITADGFGITAEARRYFAPLIAGEAPPPYVDGLPDYGSWVWSIEPPCLPGFKP